VGIAIPADFDHLEQLVQVLIDHRRKGRKQNLSGDLSSSVSF
jgi:hypothetical protein